MGRLSVPAEAQHINVLFSGGMDSTILTYLLLKEQDPRPLICWILHRRDDHIRQTVAVVQWLERHFGRKIQYQIIKTYGFIRPFVESTLLTYPGVCYTGCNKVIEGLPMTVIIPGDSPPFRGPPFNEHHLRPFIDLEKTEIIRLYVEEGVLDLLSITQSCHLPDTRCGGCYFCLERAQAATNLGLPDPNNIVI